MRLILTTLLILSAPNTLSLSFFKYTDSMGVEHFSNIQKSCIRNNVLVCEPSMINKKQLHNKQITKKPPLKKQLQPITINSPFKKRDSIKFR